MQKLNQDDKENIRDENVSDAPLSMITSIPGSFYSSPRDSLDDPQLNLSKVDLVLDGRFDIHRYLIDLLTKCGNIKFKIFDFVFFKNYNQKIVVVVFLRHRKFHS